MTCPVCKRELASTLSICLTCGAMMNDTVREELETKITQNSGGLSLKKVVGDERSARFVAPRELPAAVEKVDIGDQPAPAPKVMTRELPQKHTSPTLVEFQAKTPTVPDWRLQLQNAVRQRGTPSGALEASTPSSRPVKAPASPLKMDIESVPRSQENKNPKLESAIQRIENSRRSFLKTSGPTRAENGNVVLKKFPFEVVAPNPVQVASSTAPEAPVAAKPKLVSTLRIEKKPYDTNKLPSLPVAEKVLLPDNNVAIVSAEKIGEAKNEQRSIIAIPEPANASYREGVEDRPAFDVETPEQIDSIDDLAPFSMRFGSGLFDFILAGFGTLIILSPFLIGGGSWATVSGVLAITSTFAIFMFLYLTASLAVWGKTFGMRIFSLELIDADANVYPTLHQSAVNSAVYLLSMGLGGLGFLTVLFTEEKRAVHDIVSGTLLIREI